MPSFDVAAATSFLLCASTSTVSLGTGSAPSPAMEEVSRSTAGMTTFGIDGLIALDEAPPYGGSLRLVLRGTQFGHGTAWWSGGLDAGLGVAVAGPGLSYHVGLRVGPGHWFGDHIAVGLYSGLGMDGVAPGLPFALQSPVGAALQLNLLDGLSIALRAEGRWAFATSRVRSGGLLEWDSYAAILDIGVYWPSVNRTL